MLFSALATGESRSASSSTSCISSCMILSTSAFASSHACSSASEVRGPASCKWEVGMLCSGVVGHWCLHGLYECLPPTNGAIEKLDLTLGAIASGCHLQMCRRCCLVSKLQ